VTIYVVFFIAGLTNLYAHYLVSIEEEKADKAKKIYEDD
jgi:hypothetical protein